MYSYDVSLLLFLVLLGGAAYWQHHYHLAGRLSLIKPDGSEELDAIDDELHDIDGDSTSNRYFQFLNRFFLGHGLATAADWLQSPYIYSLYRDKHHLPSVAVAALFATSFLFSGISAPFVGTFADRYGRKRACQVYCGLYAASALTTLFSSTRILLLGRALAGVSSALLSRVFEMWMLGEFRRLEFGESEGAEKYMYCTMTTVNGFVSVAAGIVSQVLVQSFNSEVAPFMGSIVCLGLAYVVIDKTWVENYATKIVFRPKARPTARLGSLVLLAIGLTICAVEAAALYIFAFWAPFIISSRDITFSWYRGRVPFGLIFAQLTAASALGSFGYTHASSKASLKMTPSIFAQLAMVKASVCLMMTILTSMESLRFWSLCIFQFLVGFYSSSIRDVKDKYLEDHRKVKLNGLVRVPLNMLIVGALLTVENDDTSRGNRLIFFSSLLLFGTTSMSMFVP